MPLAMIVTLFVLGAVAVIGILGYWIDKSEEREERKWRH